MGSHSYGGGQSAVAAATHRPAAARLKDTYWETRRASWTLQQRGQNSAASGFYSLAHVKEQTVEWKACKNRANGTKWTCITEHIQLDVAQWIAARNTEGAEDEV